MAAPEHTDGVSEGSSSAPSYEREDLIRIINQSLRALGFESVAEHLQEESKIALESTEVVSFRGAVESGDWDLASKMLETFQQSMPPDDQKHVRSLLYREKFLELLEGGHIRGALACLRTELQPATTDRTLLYRLGHALVSPSIDATKAALAWPGTPANRRRLLRVLEQGPCSRFLLPAHRLDRLLRQALQAQRSACLYHNSETSTMSLLYDHHCHRSVIPHAVVGTLAMHDDEVWYLQFSHSGRQLATCSKDGRCLIWDVPTRTCRHVLSGHITEVEFCDWSPDDSLLLTCGARLDKTVIVWSTATGEMVRRLLHHDNTISAVAWTPDGAHFLSASVDQKLVLWCSKTFTVVHTWSPLRISSMAVTSTGRVVAVCHEHKIHVIDLATREKIFSQVETSSVTSVCVSRDGKEALVGLLNGELHLWSIANEMVPLRKFSGHTNGHYILRSCFGGVDEDFIVCGSEDGQIYIWHRATGKLLDKIEAHVGSVNAVAWSPTDHTLMASAGDDAEVRIWGPGAAAAAAAGRSGRGLSDGSDDDMDGEPALVGDTKKRHLFS